MLRPKLAVSLLALCVGAGAALAQDNLKRLEQVKTTGYGLKFEMVDQRGPNVDAIRKNLQNVKLPPGFKIDLYAIVPDARHMAVGTNLGVVFVGTRKTAIYAVTDRDKNRVADEVKPFAPSIDFAIPNGVCMSKDGFLFVAEQNRVLIFPAASITRSALCDLSVLTDLTVLPSMRTEPFGTIS